MRIGIVDYGMGNLLSVGNALTAVGATPHVVADGKGLTDVDAIVLPGVGAFGRGMAGLRGRGFVEALDAEVRGKRKPILGICLGMQLFARTGFEAGEHEGLGWLDAVTDRLAASDGLRVPHVGWNDVAGHGPLFSGIPSGASFYFVHSYKVALATPDAAAGTTEYGSTFVSAVTQGNVFGVQFHPEKSHKHGLMLLANFVAIVKAGQGAC